MFLQKAKRKIRELAYNFDSDGYVAPDLTILNDTVTKSGVNQMVFNKSQIVLFVRDDGVISWINLSKIRECCCLIHIFGGSFGNGNSVCESAASIIQEILTEDEVWVIVKRTINGATKRYVECFSDFDFDETDATDLNF